MPTAIANPRGVGTQNRAGRTKANSSKRSCAAKRSSPRRRASMRAWQTTGDVERMRATARSRGSTAQVPSGSRIAASRRPATKIGTSGNWARVSVALACSMAGSIGRRAGLWFVESTAMGMFRVSPA